MSNQHATTQPRKRKTLSDPAPPKFVDRVITVVTWMDRTNVVFDQPEVHVFYSEANFRSHVCQVLFGGTMDQCLEMAHSHECMLASFPIKDGDRHQLVHASEIDHDGLHLIKDLQEHDEEICFNDMETRWYNWFQQQPHCSMATAAAISWKACRIADSMVAMKTMTDSSTSLSDIIDCLQGTTSVLPPEVGDRRVEVMVSEPPKGVNKGQSRFYSWLN